MPPGATPGRMPFASVVLALAVALGAPAVDPAAHSAPRVDGGGAPVVILYGDSLAWEAEEHFIAAITEGDGATAVGRTFGGNAICDFFDLMKDDALSLRPAAVVLEFSGNRFTT